MTARPLCFSLRGMSEIRHPPKGYPELRTLWFQYFDQTLERLKTYNPRDALATRQAAHALGMRQATLFLIARYDRTVPEDKRVGPVFIETQGSGATFRPARMYAVSALVEWIKGLAARRLTIYGEPIPMDGARGRKVTVLANLSRMVRLSGENKTRAEKIAGRFLLHVAADLTDTLAERIVERVAARMAEEALAQAHDDGGVMEITDAVLDTGFIKPRDNVPDTDWPLSDPRVSGRAITPAQFKLALKALAMTPAQFAEFWGVNVRTVNAWVYGEIPVPLAVADYLKHSVGQFVRLRCAQLGLPVPATAIDELIMPTAPGQVRAVDALRSMVAERNPNGTGHEAVSKPATGGRMPRPRKSKLVPEPELADPEAGRVPEAGASPGGLPG